jgi:hypothetical protein
MRVCEGKTARGVRCRRTVKSGRFCSTHATTVDVRRLLTLAGSTFTGFRLAGPPGALAGLIAGLVLDGANSGQTKKVFVSFDFDHDRSLKHFVVGQANNKRTPFEVTDTSLLEAAPQKDWERIAAQKIGESDLMFVMLGQYTHRAPGVLKEVAIARRLGVKVVQIAAERHSGVTSVPGAGRRYHWSWENLEKILGNM